MSDGGEKGKANMKIVQHRCVESSGVDGNGVDG